MSDQEPPVPEPLPAIPLGKLWVALLAPSLLTLLLTLAFGSSRYLESLIMATPLASLIIIIYFLRSFLNALRVRYRGRSVTLLGWGYFIGQVFLCLAAWIGTCAIFVF